MRFFITSISVFLSLVLSLQPANSQYIGNYINNPYVPNSLSNPYGAGNPYSPKNISNDYSAYESPYSNQSEK